MKFFSRDRKEQKTQVRIIGVSFDPPNPRHICFMNLKLEIPYEIWMLVEPVCSERDILSGVCVCTPLSGIVWAITFTFIMDFKKK